MSNQIKNSNQHQLIQSQLDNYAVKELAKKMEEKLAVKRSQGYGGWMNCSKEELLRLLQEQLDKPNGIDPIDIANFCAFIHMKELTNQRTEGAI